VIYYAHECVPRQTRIFRGQVVLYRHGRPRSARLLQVSSHIFEGPFEKKGQIQEITCIIRAVWVWRTMHNDKDTNRAVLQPTSNAHRLHLLSHLLRSAWGTMGQDCWDPCNVNRDIWKSS